MKTYIGIDLGGTYIKYGLVSEAGEIIEKGKVATPAGCGYAETVEAIASAARFSHARRTFLRRECKLFSGKREKEGILGKFVKKTEKFCDNPCFLNYVMIY